MCDQAEAIVTHLQTLFSIELEYADIADSDEAVAVFGERIPVLENKRNHQLLDWPFDLEILSDWLQPSTEQENNNREC